MGGPRVAAQPVQAAANVLVSPGVNVVGKQLRTEAGFPRLSRSEVAILAVRDSVQGDRVGRLSVRYR